MKRHLSVVLGGRHDCHMPRRAKPITHELKTLPGRLRFARESRALDVTKLEDLAGVSRGRVSRIENDDRLPGLSADVVIRIAKALRVNPGWLLTGVGEMELPAGGSLYPVPAPRT